MGVWIVAIDPGCEESAYVLLDPDLRPIRFAKCTNELMYCHLLDAVLENVPNEMIKRGGLKVAIEMIASYGMPVGKEVFDTCVWIGQLIERFKAFSCYGAETTLIYRRDEKLTLCNSPRANDATIIQALIDRFASGVPNKGKGYKDSPGWFYGFKKDIWQAYAVGVTYHDMYMGGGNGGKTGG